MLNEPKLLLWLIFFISVSISLSLTGLIKRNLKLFLGTYRKGSCFYNPIKTVFLAVVIASVPFLF